MIISPIMRFIVEKQKGYPAPTEKEKLTRAINKFRSILRNISGNFNIAETQFGLADMLVGRGGPGDYKEAMRLYNNILEIAPTSYLRARALVGKAELLITSEKKEDWTEALTLCEKARKILDDDLSDFFASKTFVVHAELLLKSWEPKDHAKAIKLLDKVVNSKDSPEYFRGRAMVGRAEILLSKPKPKGADINKALKLAEASRKVLKERPSDYFFIKSKLVEAELRIRREKGADLERAGKLCAEVIRNKEAQKNLIARAKLDLAEVSRHPKALKLYKEVTEMEGLDPYLIKKAKAVEKALKAKAKKKK